MTTRLLRTSERTTFTRCRQQWWWTFEELWRTKYDAPALRFGSLVHKALELRYPPGIKRGPHPAETFQKLYDEDLKKAYSFGFKDEDGTWMNAGELGVAMLEAFVQTYGKDDQYRVISSEQTFRVRLRPGLTYVGTFDGVWQDRSNKRLLLKEWKTTTQFWFKHLPMDEQAGSYWAFAPAWLKRQGIMAEGEVLKGILYTFLRKAMPDDRPTNSQGQALNKDGTVSKRQPTPLFQREFVWRDRFDRQQIKARIIEQAREMQMVREGALSPYKNPSKMTCMGCPFLDVCELHETGADYMPLLRGAFEKFNPYDPYEIEHEGKN